MTAETLYFGDLTPETPYLDGSGRPLAGATLTFWRAGTTEEIAVYSDEELTTAFSQPITADEAGVFPTIYLDPGKDYRVRLKRADGVLVWDVDPYVSPIPPAQYLVDAFTTPGEFVWERPEGVDEVDVLVVGGGGAGGYRVPALGNMAVGGGGGGRVRWVEGYVVTGNVSGTVAAASQNPTGESQPGNPSTFGTITAEGGGAGCSTAGGQDVSGDEKNGPTGGGGTRDGNVIAAPGTGFDGGDGGASVTDSEGDRQGGGGGGAGGDGSPGSLGQGGAGGPGIDMSDLFSEYGDEGWFGAGGGGGSFNGTGGAGGKGGGGNGRSGSIAATSGQANTGGGGGGGNGTGVSAAGGSGIVIVRYRDPQTSPWVFLSPVYQARTDSGRPDLTRRYHFLAASDERTPIKAYGDAELRAALPNPLTPDAGGFFLPIYLAPNVEYFITDTEPAPTPRPTVTAIDPTEAEQDGDGFTLTVTGEDFIPASVVRWNGKPRPTTYVSATELTAEIPAADLAVTLAPRTAKVTVFTPPPGGGVSNAKVFTIGAEPPEPVFVIFDEVGEDTWTVPEGVTEIDVLVVGGGGGGGSRQGGGGGAGGLILRTNLPVVPEEVIALKVGAGGSGGVSGGPGSSGDDSSFGSFVAPGGGGGGGRSSGNDGLDGGSGGGAANRSQTPGAAVDGGIYGFPGGVANDQQSNSAGGGGGAGAPGEDALSTANQNNNVAGDGGDGIDLSHIFGDEVGDAGWFAGGGGGGVLSATASYGRGGRGGGGDGEDFNAPGTVTGGAAHTGGGGGGSGSDAVPGGSGGSGVVIVRYYT